MNATKVYYNGNIITMNAQQKFATAFALSGDRILKVGSDLEMQALINKDTECINLAGRTVVPGFYDGHSHMSMAGCVYLNTVLLGSNKYNGNCPTIQDCKDKIKAYLENHPDLKCLIGWGYDDTAIAEKRALYKEELDEISTEIPIFISHISGHISYVNSKVYELSGIDENTPDPPGGHIQHREDGSLNGILEENAMRFVRIKELDASFGRGGDIVESIAFASEIYAKAGITTANEGAAMGAEFLKQVYRAVDQNRLKVRLTVVPFSDVQEETYAIVRPDKMVSVHGEKIIEDGSIQAYTAYLSEPYYDTAGRPKDYRAYPGYSAEALKEKIKAVYAAGHQAVCHCNGDAAIDDYLDAIEEAQKLYPRENERPIIIHAQTARRDQIKRMKKLHATPSFFQIHTYYWGDRHMNIFLGPERGANISPTRWAQEENLPFSLHCDTPVVPQTPLLAIWSAVNRLSDAGNPVGQHQAIEVYEALKAHTLYAAYQYFEEDLKGSLEIGKYADFVILDRDILTCPKPEIKDIQILQTVVGGEVMYSAIPETTKKEAIV